MHVVSLSRTGGGRESRKQYLPRSSELHLFAVYNMSLDRVQRREYKHISPE